MDLDNARINLDRFKAKFPKVEVFETITLINEGLESVLFRIMDLIESTPYFPMVENKEESVIYRYDKADNEIIVTNLGNGQWRVSGDRVEKLMLRSKTDTESDVFRLGNNLRRQGVDKALREAGALDGDKVFILDFAFEFVE